MTTIAINEIDWLKGPPAQGEDIPDWQRCDMCSGSCIDDFLNGARESRKFFQQSGGNDDGLIVCENCINDFLSETPS